VLARIVIVVALVSLRRLGWNNAISLVRMLRILWCWLVIVIVVALVSLRRL